MKCLTDNQIQQLIDGELPANEIQQYKLHLKTCTGCAEKYAEQKAVVLNIKNLLNKTAALPERIPDFHVPVKTISPKRASKRIPLWAKVAAVLLPICFIWKMTNNKPAEKEFEPTPESIQLYEMCNSVDANTAFQENMITTTITDGNGKVIKCETN